MIGTSERRSAEFLAWESRGRGASVWPHPVLPEPRYVAPRRDVYPDLNAPDEGRKPTLLSSFVRRVSERLAPSPKSEQPAEDEGEREPKEFIGVELCEWQAHLPSGLKFDAHAYASLFIALSGSKEPITFEIIATASRIVVQFVVAQKDEAFLLSQLGAFFPDVSFAPVSGYLGEAWFASEETSVAAVEFGLGKEFMIPLSPPRGDPLVALFGALSCVGEGETAVFQVTFSRASSPWHEGIVRAVTHTDGSALFVNAPELFPSAKEKVTLPLFAAVIRLAIRAPKHARAWALACDVAASLGVYGSARGNELVPLSNEEYPPERRELDILVRQSCRSGMILNAEELAAFVHLPSSDVRAPRLRQSSVRTKAPPQSVRNGEGLCLGTNVHGGISVPVVLTKTQRSSHLYAIGASGTGKSSLLYNCIMQDVRAGEGVTVCDPHGALIETILGSIPDNRIQDVVLLDPGDDESVIGFNILAARPDEEKSLLVSDLVAVFRRLSDSWGHQLNSVLGNALLAFMENTRGGTLLDVRRFLLEPAFRAEYLKTVTDPEIAYYWRSVFPALSGNKSVGPVVTRLDAFLSPKRVRYMVGQKENKIDFRDIMDSGKILLVKLAEGSIGRENAHLLGSLVIAKMQAEAMSRQRQDEAGRRHHFLYCDEFHHFLTPSLAECLTGVRKYRLGLVLCHQERSQMAKDPEVSSAVLNAYTRIVFRVNETDARALEGGFSDFEASDLQRLSVGQAVCRVERSDSDFNLAIDPPEYPEESIAASRKAEVIAASRKRYGIPRTEVAEAFRKAAEAVAAPSPHKRESKPKAVAEPPRKERETAAPPPSEPIKAPVVSAPVVRDLGKGGAQHKAIQDRIREEGEKHGYRVTVEKEILGGVGQIDVALAKGDFSIACEITVTTTIDHEVGNVSKCAKAGFRRIAVVSPSEEKLQKLSAAISHSLGEDTAKLVTYHLPDAFISSIQVARPAEAKPEPEVRTRGGRIIKRRTTEISPIEAKAKEAEALAIMAHMMREKKRI